MKYDTLYTITKYLCTQLLQNNEFTMQSLSSSSMMGSYPSGSARVSNINIMMDGGYPTATAFANPTATTFATDMPK